MGKKQQKKLKKLMRNLKAGNGYGATMPATNAGGLMSQLKTRDQFMLGALVGAGAAYLLSDEALRGKLMKSAVRLYANLMGGVEEMKEQMADMRAEVEAERHGGA